MRLPNGYGSVYKLSGNRRKPWIARKTVGWTSESKQKYYTIGYYTNRKEALEALAEYNRNPIGETRDVTLGEIYETWSARRYRSANKSTRGTYQSAWNHLEVLKDMKVRDIKTSHLQSVISAMEDKKKLSQSSCQKVKILAGILLKIAIADDIVKTDYSQMVKISQQDKKKIEIFSDLDIAKMWRHENEPWVDTLLLFVHTGMRISEMLSLTKFNVDIDAMLITGGVKTDAGKNRIVPIHKDVQHIVKRRYNTEHTHLITRNGKPISPDYYRKNIFYPTLEKLGIERITPHKARHTFATLLHREGVDLKTRQMLLGHSDVSTTMHYTHPDIQTLQVAISRINTKISC